MPNNLLVQFQSAIPPLDDVARKGSAGRIAIIGGSKNYTGAPYYASMVSCGFSIDNLIAIKF